MTNYSIFNKGNNNDTDPEYTDVDLNTSEFKLLLNNTNYNVSTLFLNIRSLKKNFNDLCIFLQQLQKPFDIIGLAETWLNSEIDSDCFNLPGYNIYRKDRVDGY